MAERLQQAGILSKEFGIKFSKLDGGRTRTRTLDPLIKSQLLYQLSYAPGLPQREYRRARVA